MPDGPSLPPVTEPPPVPVPEARRLPEHRGKIGRITDDLAAISTDLTEWVELRIALAKAEAREAAADAKSVVEAKARPIIFFVGAGVVGLYALGFLLGTLGWGIAALVGPAETTYWPVVVGMGVVTLVLFLVVGVLALIGRRMQKKAVPASIIKPPSLALTPTDDPDHPLVSA